MNKKALWAIRIVAILVIIGSVLYILNNRKEYEEATEEYDILSEYVDFLPVVENTEDSDQPESEGLNVDFESLSKINPDLTGWIYACNGSISYPIVQSRDNDEYLHTTFNGRRNGSGCVFADMRDNNLSNYHSIIFGHCMRNGTMFARLMSYKTPSYLSSMPYFYIYTPTEIRKYEIFSVYRDIPNNVLLAYTDQDENMVNLYENIKAKSDYEINVSDTFLEGSGAIATLITCDDRNDRYRVVVNGKRIE